MPLAPVEPCQPKPSFGADWNRWSSSGVYSHSTSVGYRQRPKLAGSLPWPGQVSKAMMRVGLTVRLMRLFHGTIDVLPGLDHEPEQAFVLLVAVLQFLAAGLGVALLALEVHDLADFLERKVQGQLAHLVDGLLDLIGVSQLRFQGVMNRQAHCLALGVIVVGDSRHERTNEAAEKCETFQETKESFL